MIITVDGFNHLDQAFSLLQTGSHLSIARHWDYQESYELYYYGLDVILEVLVLAIFHIYTEYIINLLAARDQAKYPRVYSKPAGLLSSLDISQVWISRDDLESIGYSAGFDWTTALY